MNCLAHLFLSHDSPDSMLGNLLGDFVKGNVQGKFPQEVVRGIMNHRIVDAFTDSSEVASASRKLISRSRYRYSGIIIDVVYDFFLSRNWGLYSSDGLDEFIEKVYTNLADHNVRNVRIPQNARRFIDNMITEDWLRSYGTTEGIDQTFKRISKRMRRENNLATAAEELQHHYFILNDHFLRFFPQLLTYLQRG
jgi:acyl carrier protein phosphodiesterase